MTTLSYRHTNRNSATPRDPLPRPAPSHKERPRPYAHGPDHAFSWLLPDNLIGTSSRFLHPRSSDSAIFICIIQSHDANISRMHYLLACMFVSQYSELSKKEKLSSAPHKESSNKDHNPLKHYCLNHKLQFVFPCSNLLPQTILVPLAFIRTVLTVVTCDALRHPIQSKLSH